MTRRGISLVELMLGITLLGLFGVGVTAVVRGASRSTVRAVTALSSERTLLGANALMRHELRDAAWTSVTLASDRLEYPRRVGDGVVCDAVAGAVRVAVADWSGERMPDPTRDRIFALGADAIWRESPLAVVSPANCPDGRPSVAFTLGDPLDSVTWVRVVEPTLLRQYRSGTSDWLGLAPADGSAPVQPFAGPLRPSVGTFQRTTSLLQVTLHLPSGARVAALPLDPRP